MKYIIKIFLLLFCLQVVNAQDPIVDGYDYPIDEKGYTNGNESIIEERITPEKNPFPEPTGVRVGVGGTWRNAQDVGSFLGVRCGLHPGEDWNKGSGCDDAGERVFSIAKGKIIKVISSYATTSNPIANYIKGGWTIVIEHVEGDSSKYYSVYTHITSDDNINGELSSNISNFPTVGQHVGRGTPIARIAKGNNCSGGSKMTDNPTHLHFELRDERYDPDKSLWARDNNKGYYGSKFCGASLCNSYYSSDCSSMSNNAKKKAIRNMRSDGILDPSDFIEQNRPSTYSDLECANISNDDSNWALPYIYKMTRTKLDGSCSEESGTFLIEGFTNDGQEVSFAPTEYVTRSEMAKLTVLAGIKVGKINCLTNESTPYFGDVPPTHPNFKYIQTLADEGKVQGYGDGNYGPNNPVTREQMAKFIQQVFCIEQNITDDSDLLLLSDVNDSTWWSYFYINTLVNTRINKPIVEVTDKLPLNDRVLSGYKNSTFGKEDNVTRAQMAKFIVNGMLIAEEQNNDSNCPHNENLNRHDDSNSVLKSNNSSNYVYLGYNFEQVTNGNSTPPATLSLPTQTGNSIEITNSQNLVISHPSFYDSDGDELFFYWVADDGNLVANNPQYQSVTFEPPNVSSPTTVNLFTLSGDGNGNISKGTFQIFVQPDNASLEVTFPSNGTTFYTGTTRNIFWNSTNIHADATISLGLFKAGNLVEYFANGIDDDGNHTIAIPYNTPLGSDYHIRAYAYLNGSLIAEDDSEVFTIAEGAPPGYVDMTDTETLYYTGQNKAIQWEDNIYHNVKIELRYTNGSLYQTIANNELSDGYYFWQVPNSINPGSYKLRITSLIDGSIYDEKNITVQTPTTNYPPSVYITSHFDGQIVLVDEITLQGHSIDDEDTYQTTVSVNGGNAYSATMNVDDTWYRDIDLSPGWNTIKVRAKDYYGLWSTFKTIQVFRLREVSSIRAGDGDATDHIPVEIYHDDQPFFRIYRSTVNDYSTAVAITPYFARTASNSDDWKVYYDDYSVQHGYQYYYWAVASYDEFGSIATLPNEWSDYGHIMPIINTVTVSSNDICDGESVTLAALSPLDYTTGGIYTWQIDGAFHTGNPITLTPTNPISNIAVGVTSTNASVGSSTWHYPANQQITITDCSNPCIQIINITQNVLNGQSDIEQAGDMITAENTVFSGGAADYSAENQVVFLPSFHAQSGSNVHGYITPCQQPVSPLISNDNTVVEATIEESSNVVEDDNLTDISVFPNPTSSTFNIRFYLKNAEDVNISIVDANGRIWAQQQFDGIIGLNQFMFDASTPPTGIYLVNVTTSKSSHSVRLTIVN